MLTGDPRIFILASNDDEKNMLVAFGTEDEFILSHQTSPDDLEKWISEKHDWIFGYLSYDLKNRIEKLTTRHDNPAEVYDAHFICPSVVFRMSDVGKIMLKNHSVLSDSEVFRLFEDGFYNRTKVSEDDIKLKALLSRDQYIQAVQRVLEHIHAGDIYEVNYCQEFRARARINSPFGVWKRLNERTRAPFSAFVQTDDIYSMCGSPERYLKREGDKIITQPIKGTIRRSPDPVKDEELKNELASSLKERTENVMIVDLVRNDLSKSARRASVLVEKQFEPVSFKTVHHLVSTVSARVDRSVGFMQLIRDTFPMGSMTGAPKISAMKISDAYEASSRSFYSGSVGYIKPNGDFDFNVVIRSILYNDKKSMVSLHVGGAITAMCNPASEYDECMLKASAVLDALHNAG